MRYCPQCGAQPQANARFCTQCGARLPALAPSTTAPQSAPLDIPTVIAPAEPVRNLDETMVLPATGRAEISDDATHLAPAPQTYDPVPAPRLSEMFAAHSAPVTAEPRAPRIGEQFAHAQGAPVDQSPAKPSGIGTQFAQATAHSTLPEELAQSSIQSDGNYRSQDDAEQRSTAKFIPILAVCVLVILVIIALMIFM